MKCPNCSSHMLVAQETVNARSQVTFYRCSVCNSEHVSSEPVIETVNFDSGDYFGKSSEEKKRYIMA